MGNGRESRFAGVAAETTQQARALRLYWTNRRGHDIIAVGHCVVTGGLEMLLFSGSSLAEWMESVTREITRNAQVNTDAQLIEMYTLQLPTLRLEDTRVELSNDLATYNVPFEGWDHLFHLTPQRWTDERPSATVWPAILQIVVPRAQATEEFNRTVDMIREYLAWLEPDCNNWNDNLPALVRQAVEQRQRGQDARRNEVADLERAVRERYGG